MKVKHYTNCLITPRRVAARGRGGQVLILTLLGLTLLVGLIFYVYNIGYVMNRRLNLQSTSDAVVVSGASWMARSMNVVAMDNVGMSRSLSSVAVLDSLPLATEMSLDEANQSLQGLTAQLNRGLPNDAGGQYLQQGLNTLQQRMTTEQSILQAVDQTLNRSAFDITNTTHWVVKGESEPGWLWKSIVAMDNLSQATVASAGIVAQADAVNIAIISDTDANNGANGIKNIGRATAFLTPIVPVIPAHRTTFNDFQSTLLGRENVLNESATMRPTGGAGGAIPDMEYPHRLGPWARLYRWRDWLTVNNRANGQFVPLVKGAPNVPTMAGASAIGPTGSWIGGGGGGTIIGYVAYGPYSWMLRQIGTWANNNGAVQGQLADTNFTTYTSQISRVKLNYMFPAGVGKSPVTIHYPLWITDYAQAKAKSSDPNVRITSTRYYVVEIYSAFPENDPNYLSAGTFVTNGAQTMNSRWDNPRYSRQYKMYDVASDPAYTSKQLGNYVWKASPKQPIMAVADDPRIGLKLKLDASGKPIPQQTYLICYFVFGGIDVGGDVQISNPANWDSLEGLPAPMLLDTSTGDYDPVVQDPDAGVRRDRFTYLGAAFNTTAAKLYPTRFNTVVSTPMVAFSQAKVFNNSSWDLWTQDWQVQLDPVTKLLPPDSSNWQQKINDGMPDCPSVRDWVDIRDVQTIQSYLSQFNSNTTNQYINH